MNIVEGYKFLTEEDANLARDEVAKINYISGKLQEDNPKAVLAVYNRIIQGNIFVTPIGFDYLRTLRDYLYKCPEIPDNMITEIPARVNYSEAVNNVHSGDNVTNKTTVNSHGKGKNYKTEYITSLVFNVVMIVAVLLMFALALRADTPNIINYRNAITNEYAEWDQQLKDKEKELREREIELDEREELINNGGQN